jgi:hypothetical protein
MVRIPDLTLENNGTSGGSKSVGFLPQTEMFPFSQKSLIPSHPKNGRVLVLPIVGKMLLWKIGDQNFSLNVL